MALAHAEERKRSQSHVVDPQLSPFEDPNSSQYGVMDPRDQEPPTPSPPKPADLQAPDVKGTPAELLERKKVLQDLKTRLQEKHIRVPIPHSNRHHRGLLRGQSRLATRRTMTQIVT